MSYNYMEALKEDIKEYLRNDFNKDNIQLEYDWIDELNYKVKTNDKQRSNNFASFSHKSKRDYCLTSKIFSDSEGKRAYGFEKYKWKKKKKITSSQFKQTY